MQERIVDMVLLYKPVGPNTYKVGKVIVSRSVGLQPRQTVLCKYIRVLNDGALLRVVVVGGGFTDMEVMGLN